MKKMILFLGIMMGFGPTMGQSFLSLQKPMDYRNIKYHEGDYIHLKLRNKQERIKGTIQWFNDTLFSIEDFGIIPLRSISSVIRGPERGGLVVSAPKAIITAAAMFLIADIYNSGFNPSLPTFIIAGSIALASVPFLPFRYRKHSMKRGWRLYYIDKSSPIHVD